MRAADRCHSRLGSDGRRCAQAADQPLLGIVSISANEANNARYIAGATAAAKEDGWTVSVIDAAGSADQANSAIQNFAGRGAGAIIDMVFPWSSIGAGLAAAKDAGVPVVTWGGGLGGSVAATNGSGAPIAQPVIDKMVADLGGKGDLLALTYRTGEVCRNRETLLDQVLTKNPASRSPRTKSAFPATSKTALNTPMPGWRRIRRATASRPSGAAGTIRPSARSGRCASRAATMSGSMASTATRRRSRTSRTAT